MRANRASYERLHLAKLSNRLAGFSNAKPPFDGFAVRHFQALQNVTGVTRESLVEYSRSSVTHYNSFTDELSLCNGSARDGVLWRDIGPGSLWLTANRTNVSFLPPHGAEGVRVLTHVRNTGEVRSAGFFIQTITPAVGVAT